MSVSFIFLIAVLNLGLGFAAAVVIKRRYETLIARRPLQHAATKPDTEKKPTPEINQTAAEAIEAVEDLLSQVGLQPIGGSETDAADDGADSGADGKTDSEDLVEAADVDLQSLTP